MRISDWSSDVCSSDLCMVVLSAIVGAPENKSVRALMTRSRRAAMELLTDRVRRGQAEGDVPATADASAIAAFYTTLVQGMSIQARDGATRKQLLASVELALAAWDGLVAAKSAKAKPAGDRQSTSMNDSPQSTTRTPA